jgi:glycosyltransferase involved in cell wall biosynthesis
MGSRRELVSDGETGLLYRTGDVQHLKESIETLGSQPDLAEKMGRAGWERVRDQYSPESHSRKLLSLYEGLIAAKTPEIAP